MQKSHQKQSKQQAKKRKQQEKATKHQQAGKKNKHNKPQSSSEQSDEDIDLNQIEQGEEVEQEEVNFLVAEINQQYYHSLKTILLRLSQITKTTNSELADAVVQGKEIGNIVLADDEEDQDEQDDGDEEELEDDQQNAYSVLTILSSKKKSAKNIKKVVSKSAESKGLSAQVQSLINNESTNIIVNQRLANLPAFITNSYHEVFKKDMLELKQKDRKKYDQYFSGYLLNVSQIQYQGSQDLDKLVYSKFQDFEMCQRAKAWWLGQKNNTFKKKADMRSLYYVIKAEEYFKGVDKIRTYLDE